MATKKTSVAAKKKPVVKPVKPVVPPAQPLKPGLMDRVRLGVDELMDYHPRKYGTDLKGQKEREARRKKILGKK